MAKKAASAATESAEVAEPVSAEDFALALRATQDITGFGEPGARARLAELKPGMIAKIAELERKDKRVEIVTLLYA